jgi:hypothetical protein
MKKPIEALIAIETAIVRDVLKIPPYLGVLLPTIREAIVELIGRRRMEGGSIEND